MTVIRSLRLAAKASQSAFAARLGVSVEVYRPWDSRRRETPPEVIMKAREISNMGADDHPQRLQTLARALGVSVFRLREAARDGRLVVTYDTRTAFGRPIPRATRLAGEAYRRTYYGKRSRWVPRPLPPKAFVPPPQDFDRRLIAWRKRLSMSQAQFARSIGAASKAVVYQWESRKRVPSPLFWSRIVALVETESEFTSVGRPVNRFAPSCVAGTPATDP